ncbi:MAG: response regulator transcription factor [Bacteroidetes bacterium]|nr:response regulator transcription factor [Bacteroidota bacterium]
MINAIAIDDEPLAINVIETFCKDVKFINLQRSFTKPTEALKYLRKFPVDLIFLDIKMPTMSGLNLLKAVQQNTMVIFTTAFSDYAAESYELNAIDYLLKPINPNRFTQAVNKAQEYFNYIHKTNIESQKDIFIRADFSLIKVPLADILYIESLGDYLKVNIKDRKTVVARMTMKEIAEILPSKDFIRVHRSYILPVSKIQSVRNKIIYTAEKEIPIGNTYAEDILNIFKDKF